MQATGRNLVYFYFKLTRTTLTLSEKSFKIFEGRAKSYKGVGKDVSLTNQSNFFYCLIANFDSTICPLGGPSTNSR